MKGITKNYEKYFAQNYENKLSSVLNRFCLDVFFLMNI
jgi:hypothetical protein